MTSNALKIIIEKLVSKELKHLNKKIIRSKRKLWAEDVVLPGDESRPPSTVKMPFEIVDFGNNLDIIMDATVTLDPTKDSKEVKLHKNFELKLNDPNLYATQDHLYLETDDLKKHINRRSKDNPIVVMLPNKVKLIQDGHHRLSAQKLLGNSTCLIDLYEIMNWVDIEEESEEFFKNLGGSVNEMNAIGGGGISATGGAALFGTQKEEVLGKRDKNGPTYFQMGGSLPDELYNKKNGKPSRDPGIAGLKENSGIGKEIIACRSGYTHNFNPAQRGSMGPGYYFTTNPERAKKYGDGGIVWVKIKLNNPYITKKTTLGDEFGQKYYIDNETGSYDFEIGGEINQSIRNENHDGIIATEKNGKTIEIVVFDEKSFEPINPPNTVKESYFHGTTVDLKPGDYLLPPNETNNVSEKGRKKNLDKIFYTASPKSAMIYAGRAKHSLGGEPKVYLIEPEGQIETLNNAPGTEVYMSPKAKIIKRIK